MATTRTRQLVAELRALLASERRADEMDIEGAELCAAACLLSAGAPSAAAQVRACQTMLQSLKPAQRTKVVEQAAVLVRSAAQADDLERRMRCLRAIENAVVSA